MRIQMTVTEVDEERWAYLQSNVQPEYKIPEGATRVCLTFSHGEEERHVEMPMGTVVGLLMGLGMVSVTREMRAALARLRPVDLPDFLISDEELVKADPSLPFLPTPDMVRNLSSKEAVELTELLNRPCEHNSPVIYFEPSQFDGAPPVRFHKDGCQSYGPYSEPGEYSPPLLEKFDPATGRYTIDPDKA
jgi:hypothetical protein